MPAPYPGGCSCGKVRFQIESEPMLVYACHCTDCQRWSGTAFTMGILINRASFTVLAGEPVPYPVKLAAGTAASGCMCNSCGTRLWRIGRRNTDLLILRAGTLDHTSWLCPDAHVWARSAQRRLTFPEYSVVYETQPEGGWDEIIQLSQAKKNAMSDRPGNQV
jgi:hypothetical protein